MRAALLVILCFGFQLICNVHAEVSDLADADVKFKEGVYDVALKKAKAHLKLDPKSLRGLEIASKSSLQLHKYRDAAYYAEKVFMITKSPRYKYLQAAAIRRAGDLESALKLANQVTDLDSNYGPAYLLKAEIYEARFGIGDEYVREVKKAAQCDFKNEHFKADLKAAQTSIPK
jgi:hypothetical protein